VSLPGSLTGLAALPDQDVGLWDIDLRDRGRSSAKPCRGFAGYGRFQLEAAIQASPLLRPAR